MQRLKLEKTYHPENINEFEENLFSSLSDDNESKLH